MRVTVVGAGFVGATTAMRVVQKGLAEVVLIDIIEGLPQGIALDMKQSSPVEAFEPAITGTNDYADTAGSDVEVITLGSHGDAMVPLPRHATVEGKPLVELVDDETLERLFARTRDAGAEIVGLLKKGSAYYGPSASVAQMVNAIAGDTKEILPVCAWSTGEYGISDVYVGVPARLGRGGVEQIVEMDLNDDELAQLRDAPEGIREKCKDLEALS